MKTVIFALFALSLGAGCAAKRSYERSYSPRARYARQGGSNSMDVAKVASTEEAPSSPSEPVTADYATTKKDLRPTKVAENKPAEPVKAKSDRTNLSRRMIIYYGRLAIGVFDPEKAVNQAMAMANKYGGYLKSRRNNRLTVRIPAKKFFDFLTEIEGYGKVTSRSVSSEDVTARFVDLSMRMNNLIAARDRLKAILSKATKVKDTLAIEKELTRVTGEIERIKGQLRYLGNLVSFATVKLSFYERHSQSKFSYRKIKVQTPIYWIKGFDIITLFRN